MKKKSLSLLVLMLTLLLLLAACASDKETAKENQETTPVTFEKNLQRLRQY